MGVKYIQYKIAKCDICGEEKHFDPAYSLPHDWDEITDTHGLLKYKCVCHECIQRIHDYIEEFKALHYKADMEDEK